MIEINTTEALRNLADLINTIKGIEPTLEDLKKAQGDRYDFENFKDLLKDSFFPQLDNRLKRVKKECIKLQKLLSNAN